MTFTGFVTTLSEPMSSASASVVTTVWGPAFSKAQENGIVRDRPGRIWPTGCEATRLPSTSSASSPGENATEPELTTSTVNVTGRSVPKICREGTTEAIAAFRTPSGRSSVRHTTGGRRWKFPSVFSTRRQALTSSGRQP